MLEHVRPGVVAAAVALLAVLAAPLHAQFKLDLATIGEARFAFELGTDSLSPDAAAAELVFIKGDKRKPLATLSSSDAEQIADAITAGRHPLRFALLEQAGRKKLPALVVAFPDCSPPTLTVYDGADGDVLLALRGDNGNGLGSTLLALPDLTGDGSPEFAASAPGADGGKGHVLIIDGGSLAKKPLHVFKGSRKGTHLGENFLLAPGSQTWLLIGGPGTEGKGGEKLAIDLTTAPQDPKKPKALLERVAGAKSEAWDGDPATLAPPTTPSAPPKPTAPTTP